MTLTPNVLANRHFAAGRVWARLLKPKPGLPQSVRLSDQLGHSEQEHKWELVVIARRILACEGEADAQLILEQLFSKRVPGECDRCARFCRNGDIFNCDDRGIFSGVHDSWS